MTRHSLPQLRVIAATLLLLLAGCTSTTPNPTPPPSPAPTIERWGGYLSETRRVWSAEEGIDVLTGPAVVVRAYRESIDLAQAMGDENYVYPGFARAVLPNESESKQMSAWDRWPIVATPEKQPLFGVSEKQPLFGTQRSHILKIDQSGRDVSAIVCSYDYATAIENEPGTFVNRIRAISGPTTGIRAYLVRMVAPEQDKPTLPPQEGPAPAPVADVFGDWKVVGALNTSAYNGIDLVREWPTFRSDLAACVDKAPDVLERRQFLLRGEHPRTDFPTLPPAPGWPDASR